MTPEKNNTYCYHPSKALALKGFNKGKLEGATPCCHMSNDPNNKYPLKIDNVENLTPEEIFNHSRMKLLRENLKNKIKDTACQICWEIEDRGLKSPRLFSNNYLYKDKAGNINNDVTLVQLDVTASNICNLACRMCSPSASHLLMKDYNFFEKNKLRNKAQFATGERFGISVPYQGTESIQWKWMEENTDKIKILRASGGEPFYDKKVTTLLDKFIDTGNAKNTNLQFHTNATQFTPELCNMLNQFKSNNHTFSVDGSHRVYEYIRHPQNFNKLDHSIRTYVSHIDNLKFLEFTMIVSAHNILSIVDYVKWVYTFGIEPQVTFSEIFTFHRGVVLKHMPVYLLEKAKEDIEKIVDPSQRWWDNLITMIDLAIEKNEENGSKLKLETVLFDKSRNQSYNDYLHKDLAKYLDSSTDTKAHIQMYTHRLSKIFR